AESAVETQVPDLVFVAPSGQPIHRKTAYESTNELMKRAKVPAVGFHALRHTCASILINRGADSLRVQRHLGHSNVRMTLDTYSHLFEERLKENVDLLDQAFQL
ncbi:MAG: tyrosine-type recombinase/integrase, partial [Fimbriimonadaceae bacterium]